MGRLMRPRSTSESFPRDTWRDRAACVGYDPEAWFRHDAIDIAGAKQICRHDCPVINECLQWALEHREDWGVWGGKTREERERIRRNGRRRWVA